MAAPHHDHWQATLARIMGLDPERRYLWEERAGILEFEAGVHRRAAEVKALHEVEGRVAAE